MFDVDKNVCTVFLERQIHVLIIYYSSTACSTSDKINILKQNKYFVLFNPESQNYLVELHSSFFLSTIVCLITQALLPCRNLPQKNFHLAELCQNQSVPKQNSTQKAFVANFRIKKKILRNSTRLNIQRDQE
jgi:hypothetical protein